MVVTTRGWIHLWHYKALLGGWGSDGDGSDDREDFNQGEEKNKVMSAFG